jgi:hypothetical protein
MKQKLMEVKGETDKSTTVLGEFNTFCSGTDYNKYTEKTLKL